MFILVIYPAESAMKLEEAFSLAMFFPDLKFPAQCRAYVDFPERFGNLVKRIRGCFGLPKITPQTVYYRIENE